MDARPYRQQIERLGLKGNVTVLDRFLTREEAGVCFAAADLVVLPYARATQSGVVPIAVAHAKPVAATAVGGLREQVLAMKEREFILAARAVGVPQWQIVRRHLLPNMLAPLLVQASFDMGGAITAVAGLSFIGFGAQPPTPEWGVMISEARNYMATAWWLGTFPALAIMLVVGGFNPLGDGPRDLLDPRLRGR